MMIVVVVTWVGGDRQQGGLPKLSPFSSSSSGDLSNHKLIYPTMSNGKLTQ